MSPFSSDSLPDQRPSAVRVPTSPLGTRALLSRPHYAAVRLGQGESSHFDHGAHSLNLSQSLSTASGSSRAQSSTRSSGFRLAGDKALPSPQCVASQATSSVKQTAFLRMDISYPPLVDKKRQSAICRHPPCDSADQRPKATGSLTPAEPGAGGA